MRCLEEGVNCALKRGLQREAGVRAKGHERERKDEEEEEEGGIYTVTDVGGLGE